MSGGGGTRVSIPEDLRKTIQDIKEIATNHSDDDIYAVLKDCNLDPHETVQRLLYIDTFHEVKKKRDRRKMNASSRTYEDFRSAPGMQSRGGRDGRGDYSSYIPHDAVGGRNVSARKENGVDHTMRNSRSSLVSQKAENNRTPYLSSSSHGRAPKSSAVNNSNLPKGISMNEANDESTVPPQTFDVKKCPATSFAPGVTVDEGKSPSSFGDLPNMVSASVSGVYSTASDPILDLGQNSRITDSVGTIKRHDKSQSTATKPNVSIPVESRSSSVCDVADGIQTAAENSSNGIRPSISQKIKKSQLLVPSEPSSLPRDDIGLVVISNRDCPTPQQLIDPPKVKASSQSALEEATSKLDMKLEKLKISAQLPVIFPDHLQVPEAYKNGLTFGSLDVAFGQSVKSIIHADDGNVSSPIANLLQGNHEAARGVSQSNPTSVSPIAQEEECFDHPQSPRVPENVSPLEENILAAAVSSNDQLKQERLLPVGPPYPLVQHMPNYTFGFASPIPGNQLVQSEGLETQGGNALAVSTSGTNPPATQPTGGGQSSTAVSVPVMRQQYPPNYFSYAPYLPGFFPPHFLHQYLAAGGFPQQPSTGNAYLPPASAAPGVKLANIPQGKLGTNAGNPSHLGLQPSYGLYNTPVGYNPNSGVISGTSAGNEDPAVAAMKENNLYTKVQQNEGPYLWYPPPGRDNISNLQGNSVYNVQHQGQHYMLSPAQVGHGAYTGVYHPAQSVVASSTAPPQLMPPSQAMGGPVEAGGPPSIVYQQQPPHHALNWSPNC